MKYSKIFDKTIIDYYTINGQITDDKAIDIKLTDVKSNVSSTQLTWIKNSVNRWVLASDRGAGHYFGF